ncbi:hypothetical protein P170DRAFT_362036 [Aspergillus steynii IBT 23096]|uniref:Uncharacterized protein n=1 Tax=Aspergillus steynii IBT 23096 TaxID=1392250 RepID=A0A2I2G350_9EURO|nr:uncharacterized protein P170DRAFT_362036 [Aspergillus steynii IBT 23096]PLB47298.1 hypothetical protein P170DRAFT_362036 [Aspergillus steynii IBT 23096]
MALPLQELTSPPQEKASPLQEVISPPQKETSPPQEEISLLPRETSLPQDEISLPHREETSLTQHHAPIISVAAKALAKKDIPVVEYGQQIQWRYGDPVVLLRVEWAVPDELLSIASETLSDLDFPRVPPSTEAVVYFYGEWERACIIHRLGQGCPVYLYSRSFIGLALQDTCQVTSTFDRTLKILTPKPPKYMVSLLRHLLSHPLDVFRLRVKDDLLSFICFYILREKPLNTKVEGWDDESEEDYQKRVGEALKEMETWDWGAGREEYLRISESVLRDARTIDQLTC